VNDSAFCDEAIELVVIVILAGVADLGGLAEASINVPPRHAAIAGTVL
jgi:hypothetical protein